MRSLIEKLMGVVDAMRDSAEQAEADAFYRRIDKAWAANRVRKVGTVTLPNGGRIER